MKTGIYEQLITQLLQEKLEQVKGRYYVESQTLQASDAALYLSRFLQNVIHSVLDGSLKGPEKLQLQVNLSNALILWLKDYLQEEDISEQLIDAKGELLMALYETQNPVAADLKNYVAKVSPLTGLSQSELFTGSNLGLSLESELKREIRSSDEICWLVSFIKWTGIRIFAEDLMQFGKSGKKLKIITTSYMGATDLKAVEFLSKIPNCSVKLSYNTGQERLHAKTYIFRRYSGFDTAYIGSSNISRSALTNGLEWNLKVTTQEIPHIIEKFKSTFETYWNSPEFEHYKKEDSESYERLKNALKQARGERGPDEPTLFFDLAPRIYQKEILEKLEVERNIHGRFKNLVVAATGTGKTMVAAFDFKRFQKKNPQAKLLFVAHREEILKQSRQTFRAVLRDHSFGELWVGNHHPEHYDQLFVSVQTLKNKLSELQFSRDFYDFMIIDEVHHISASSYRPILKNLSPDILLGLTATPERQDGANILDDFCGVIATELRLPDAINERYLCPFQYFGVDDPVDLSQTSWKAGRYDRSELTKVYTAGDARVDHILRNMQDIIGDLSSIRALAFCVTQDHAEYMMRKFISQGVKAAALTSRNGQDRTALRNQLIRREINVLFVVDIFNEGVDIPEIDTVLFLRPTESLTIFLQQLGRGLRLADDKDCLTVLDFVGNAHANYDFASKFRALTGKNHISTLDEIEQDFPHLPLGCSIVLQKQAKEVILNNIKNAVVNQRRLLGLVRSYSEQSSLPLTLRNFVKLNPNVSLEHIYQTKINGGGGWSRLCIKAGVTHKELDKEIEKSMFRAISNRLLQCSSREYLQFVLNLVRHKFSWDRSSEIQNQMAMMVHYDFWQKPGVNFGYHSLEESLRALGQDDVLCEELEAVLELALERIEIQELPMKIGIPLALNLHARYSRDQILAAFGEHQFDKKSSSREGVLDIKSINTELLFVTLDKSDKKFSPSTSYHDYAVNEWLFHWQTQNSARPDKGKGLEYVNHLALNKQVLLFIREKSKDEYGRTMGFVNIGPVKIDSYNGLKPMNITWQLHEPLPPHLWHDAAKLAVG